MHIAPLGLIEDGAHWIIAPFKPSRTLDNLRSMPFAVASHTDDVRVFAGCVTGRKGWPTMPATTVKGGQARRTASRTGSWRSIASPEDEQRPRFRCALVHRRAHAPWGGYNRAQAAVLELAVLTTRLKMLPVEKVEAELKYLEIAIAKTAGPREQEAWGWLMEKVSAWRASAG